MPDSSKTFWTYEGQYGDRYPRPSRVVPLVALGLFALIVACMGFMSLESSPSDRVTVCRNGGPFDDNRVRQIIDPGEGPTLTGLNTDCFSYPVSTRIYTASSDDGADGPALACTTSDAVGIKMAVSVRFTLNTESHDLITDEFNEVLNRYDAHSDEGWDRLLQDTIRRELDSQVERTCRDFEGREMASGGEALQAVQTALASNLRERVNENVGVTLFCGPGVPYGGAECPELTVSVTRIVPTEDATRVAFEALVREEANTRAAQQAIRTAEAQAESIRAQAEAAAQAGDDYVRLQLIELCRDHPDACPTLWVLPSGEGLDITAPAP